MGNQWYMVVTTIGSISLVMWGLMRGVNREMNVRMDGLEKQISGIDKRIEGVEKSFGDRLMQWNRG